MKRRTWWWLGGPILAVLLLEVGCNAWLFTASPYLPGVRPELPVDDTLSLYALHRRRWGHGLFSQEGYVSSRDLPGFLRRRIYRWRVEPPGSAFDPGQARVDNEGRLIGVTPGYVMLTVSLLGRRGSSRFHILPRVVEFGVTPSAVHLKINERQDLRFAARLEGGGTPPGWSPAVWFPSPDSPGERMRSSESPVADAYVLPNERQSDDAVWLLRVVGKAAGTTTIFLEVGPRELAVPVTVTGDSVSVKGVPLPPDS